MNRVRGKTHRYAHILNLNTSKILKSKSGVSVSLLFLGALKFCNFSKKEVVHWETNSSKFTSVTSTFMSQSLNYTGFIVMKTHYVLEVWKVLNSKMHCD